MKRGRGTGPSTALSHLGRPPGSGAAAASLRSTAVDAGERRVEDLIRGAPVICPGSTSVQEAAGKMVAAGAGAVLVDLGDGFGIVTDQDLRIRVLAAGASLDTPLRRVMTAPAIVIRTDRTGADALLEMVERGVRHLPVVDADGHLLGVVDDIDLMAAEQRSPFHLRRAVARAREVDAVVELGQRLPATVIALHDAFVAPKNISRIISSIEDALTRRLIDLAALDLGEPPVQFTWLALGSSGRRESFPGSDQDSALAWAGRRNQAVARRSMRALAERVVEGLRACGVPSDPHGTLASSPQFSRSVTEWQRAASAWVNKLDYDAVVVASAMTDSRPISPTDIMGSRLAEAFLRGPDQEQLLRRLAVIALAHRPPTGIVRDFVVEHSGARKGLLDIKRGGLRPIVDLARWAMIAARVPVVTSTLARLDAAEAGGALESDEAAVLRNAFELITALRMHHQVDQLRAGEPPTEHIDPTRLAGLTRRYLKDAFRAIGRVQRGLEVRMGLRGV